MKRLRIAFLCLYAGLLLSGHASAQDIRLSPKYGGLAKTVAQTAADQKFLEAMDAQFGGDRKHAAQEVSMRGWQYMRQRNAREAMFRFNQAWLLNPQDGLALWGMAAVQASAGKLEDSLILFKEAEPLMGADIDFSVDHARMVGIAAARSGIDDAVRDALRRFEVIDAKSPENTINLQNWAITLFTVGRYSEAWEKVKLAEATPRAAELDQAFVAALAAKLPRP